MKTPAIRKNKFPLILSQTVLAAAVLAGACDPGLEQDLTMEGQSIVTSKSGFSKEIDVGFGVKRPLETVYGTICKKYEKVPSEKPGFPATQRCVQPAFDDSLPYARATLFQDTWMRDYERDSHLPGWNPKNSPPMEAYPAARACGSACAKWQTVPAYKPGGPARQICTKINYNVCIKSHYAGCGPAAAANVLFFYGGEQIGPAEIRSHWVDTIDFPDGNIGSTPDSLGSGLQDLLAWKADGNFKVTRKSGVNVEQEIRKAVNSGNPIIVLVNNGNHYVMVTGYENGNVRVTDYLGSERKEALATLGFGTVGPEFLGRSSGYLPNTVITIERTPGWGDGLIKAVDDPAIYRHTNGKPCGLSWPQFVALGKPAQKVLSSLDGQRFRSIFNMYPGKTCSNAEAGTYTDGIYKASNDPTVFSLKGQIACALTWDQFVKLGQPSFRTLTPTEATRFREGFYAGKTCTNYQVGL